ncbi:NDUB4 dehydrogenase, partial [Leucopsar rothschildi]|nr:NDUB4 dehydrogenase [Leucopsar rothschildi]
MASAPPPSAAGLYRPNRFVSLPAELDPNTYDTSPEKRRAEAERLAIRSRLKRHPRVEGPRQSPAGLTAFLFTPQEDPALIRWAYAKSQNVYPTFRPTPKTSFLGAAYALGPLLFWIFVLKADRDCKEKRIQEGKYKRPFSVFF